jgi:type IV pilus assembly protein PilW
MRKPLRSRGFTLVELLVGAAVGAVVLVGISLTFISQAQQYQAHASRRALQANARQGLAFMGRQVRLAGYGVNPDRAILAYDSYNAVADATLTGYPDALVLHSRDPLFRRVVSTATPDTIVLQTDATTPDRTPLSRDLMRGQILLLVCGHEAGGTSENPQHAFVTVGAPTPAGTATITLENIAPTAAPNSPTARPGRLFHEQALLAQPCFSDGTAQVVKINRSAFYLDLFPDGTLMTPYLMLHQGLDVNGDGTINRDDAVPVAEGLEQLQVAYILHTNDDDPPTIRGVTGAMPPTHYGELWEEIAPTTLEPGWFFNPNNKFSSTDLDNMREMDHPANIRQVRLTLVARSSLPSQGGYAGDDLLLRPDGSAYPDGEDLPGVGFTWRHLENLDLPPATSFTPQGGGFWRVIFRESITPKNLLLNRQFVPPAPKGGG